MIGAGCWVRQVIPVPVPVPCGLITTANTGTVSIFPAPLVEWILLRYGGPKGGKIIDAFAGGPPRGVVSAIMGFQYTGVELRQEQIDENETTLSAGELGIAGAELRIR